MKISPNLLALGGATPPPPGARAPSGALNEALRAGEAREDIAKAGREFEAILVRQMLASSIRIGGESGYGDMAVEALATAVTSAGGLGLGKAIEAALSTHTPRPAAPGEEK